MSTSLDIVRTNKNLVFFKCQQQRVFTSIKKAMGIEDDNIDFSTITYGQLFAFVKKETLLACQELKFQAKYGNKRKKRKKEEKKEKKEEGRGEGDWPAALAATGDLDDSAAEGGSAA